MRRPAVLRVDPWWALRRRFRTPAAHWTVAAVLGIGTVAAVGGQLDRARAEAERYGRWQQAVVAVHDLPAGHALGPGDLRVVRLPAAMVPRGALRSVPSGRRTSLPVAEREVLVAGRLRGGTSALAAQVPTHRRAVAVGVAEPSLALRRGDLVDLLAPDPAVGSHRVLVADARVLARAEGVVTVLVPVDDLPDVGDALAAGTVQLALSGR